MAVIVKEKYYKKDSSRERPISILLNNESIAISQGTPEDLAELAVGFLLSEGLLSDRLKLLDVEANMERGWVNVISEEGLKEKRPLMQRVTSSGCKEAAILKNNPILLAQNMPVDESIVFKADDLMAMMEQLCFRSPKRNRGECVHGCGIGNGGELLLVREDIGRHNAMDKLIGQAWIDGVNMETMALMTTGRISYEMALKACQSGVSVLVSHKSATDSAVEVAETLGITLVGKCRDNSLTVLSHHHRVQG